jgi:hypothetical protein
MTTIASCVDWSSLIGVKRAREVEIEEESYWTAEETDDEDTPPCSSSSSYGWPTIDWTGVFARKDVEEEEVTEEGVEERGLEKECGVAEAKEEEVVVPRGAPYHWTKIDWTDAFRCKEVCVPTTYRRVTRAASPLPCVLSPFSLA